MYGGFCWQVFNRGLNADHQSPIVNLLSAGLASIAVLRLTFLIHLGYFLRF